LELVGVAAADTDSDAGLTFIIFSGIEDCRMEMENQVIQNLLLNLLPSTTIIDYCCHKISIVSVRVLLYLCVSP
jgi:hypothetical protein